MMPNVFFRSAFEGESKYMLVVVAQFFNMFLVAVDDTWNEIVYRMMPLFLMLVHRVEVLLSRVPSAVEDELVVPRWPAVR